MSKRVQLSVRGFKLLVSTVPMAALGLVLRDPLLLAAVVGLWLYLVVGYYQVNWSLSRLHMVVIEPGSVLAALTAGGSFQEPLVIESGLNTDLEVYSSLTGASVKPTVLAPGSNSAVFAFNPALSGTFTADSLTVYVNDRLGLLRGSGEVDFPASFQVYPRVFPVAVRAIQFLVESGYPAEGEYSTLLRGRSLEYAETREYVPGDPLNMFDWKALARTGTPYVKQYYLEGGSDFHVVYDEVTPDPVSLDELNSGFLELVLAVAQAGSSLRLGVLEKKGTVNAVAFDPYDSLRAALRMCLSGKSEEFREYYHLIEPLKSRVLDPVLEDVWIGSSPQNSFVSSEAPQRVIVVSSLCGDPVPLIKLVEGSRDSGGTAVLRTGVPWVWTPSLGRSVIMYSGIERKTRVLSRLGVDVYSGLEDMMRHVRRTIPEEISRRVK
ncbi:MAG: DUF58 domain-containing protein [Candidatus Bathyarchaeota archaeon]